MFNIYRKLKWFILEEKKRYLLMLFLLLLISFVALVPAKLLGMAIDMIVNGGVSVIALTRIVLLMVAVPMFRYGLSFFYNHMMTVEAQKLTYKLRQKYLRHLFEMDSTFYETYPKGDLISRVTNDLDAITVAATSLLEGLIFNVGTILFAIAIMGFSISWPLTLVSVTIMPIALTILNIIRFQKRKYIRIHREIYSEMTEKVLESVEGMKVIRAYVQEKEDL
ncbi:MAG: ABC transporter transmembrane domain-containing protein, partial [Candidatus Izemoplasmatales bacterium]